MNIWKFIINIKTKSVSWKIAVDTQLSIWLHQLERVLTSRSSHQLLSHLKARFSYWTLTDEDWKHLIYCHYYEENYEEFDTEEEMLAAHEEQFPEQYPEEEEGV